MTHRSKCNNAWSLFVAVTVVTLAQTIHAVAAPRINELNLRGLQIGESTTLIITGGDLAPEPKLILDIPNTEVRFTEATPNRLTLEVTVPQDASPGIYSLRIARQSGISNPILIGVDSLPQQELQPAISQLPVALHGQITGTAVASTNFEGVKGQRIVIDVEAQRLGGKLNPVIELCDHRDIPIQWAQESSTLSGDARLVANLPTDGKYTVKLHDVLFQGASPGYFRMKIGDLKFTDFAFPMGVQAGTQAEVELVGMDSAKGSAHAGDVLGLSAVRLPSGEGWTGPAPPIQVSLLPEITEPSPEGDSLQQIEAPAAVTGRLSAEGEVDRYQVKVKPGQQYRFEVFANRLGTRVDGVLILQNEKGGELARSDDRPGTIDPGLDFTVPNDVETVIAVVNDLVGRGGPDSLYRLEIEPLPVRDFELTVSADRYHVPQQGVALLQVNAVRRGYGGPISLSLPGLPTSMLLSGTEIPAGRTRCLLTAAADDNEPFSQQLITVRGHAKGPVKVVRDAQRAETPATQRHPWLRRDIGLAVTPAAPLQIAWQTSDENLPIGFGFTAKVEVQRRTGVTGAVRLSLVSSQIPPVIQDGADKGKPDLQRTLRFEGTPQIAADQTQADPEIIVPGDLPGGPYDLVIKAELLSSDGQKVVATALTQSKRVTAVTPLQLLASNVSIEAKSGEGETGTVKGRLRRLADISSPVTVTLTGLPKELPAPSVAVAPEQDEFELPISFPFGSALGELKDVKLQATATISGNKTVASNQVPLTVTVVAGDPPPPPGPLYRVFEDERFFLALLYEGDGKGELEPTDRLAGNSALKISTNQLYRANMPGWNLKITENPKEGEFRYLRFAWKKQGGENILLQLNANGSWGPSQGTQGPAYRYEAGPKANPFNVAAVKVSEELPQTWTVVTRDLFADFGEFALTGLALTPGPGEYGLFDHVYLARSLDDFKDCPEPIQPHPPLAVFEDESDFPSKLTDGNGQLALEAQDKFAGAVSLKVTPEQRFNASLPGLGMKIRKDPGEGEYRYLRYAWKKQGGTRVCLQINHDGIWGPNRELRDKDFRYDAGTGPESYSAAVRLQDTLPSDWQIVTRDLYADFGEFTFTGLALSPIDGDFALFDHIYLAKTPRDFDLVHPQAKK